MFIDGFSSFQTQSLLHLSHTVQQCIYMSKCLCPIKELTIPGDGFTYSFVDYKSVLDRSGGYHVWHHPEIIMS